MPALTDRQKTTMNDYLRRKILILGINPDTPQKIFDFVFEDMVDRTMIPAMETFCASELVLENTNQEDQAKALLEDRGYSVTDPA